MPQAVITASASRIDTAIGGRRRAPLLISKRAPASTREDMRPARLERLGVSPQAAVVLLHSHIALPILPAIEHRNAVNEPL
jgi:hypothetical protein